MRDNKKRESLDDFEGEGEGENIGYVPLLFVANPPLQKKSDRLTDFGEGTRSLNHLVCISKIC